MKNEKQIRNMLKFHKYMMKRTERWEKKRHEAIVEILVTVLS